MIGIMDYDFTTQKMGLGVPSIEAMKMASYLKKYEKKTCMLICDIQQIINCEQVHFFSNKPIDEIPQELFFFDNVKLYGDFLQEELKPIVHHMNPDTSIYNAYIQSKLADEKIGAAKALQFLDSVYIQTRLGEEILPLPLIYPKKRVYIYDKDFLSYSDCWEILDKIIEKKPSSIYTFYPIQCHTVKQFFYLREEYEKVSRANKIFLDYYVPPHELEKYFGKYKMKLLGEITKNSNIYIYIGKNYGTPVYNNTFYIKNLLYTLNLLFSYYSRNIPIMADIYYPKIEENPYLDIYKCIKSWANNLDYDKKLIDCFRTKHQKEVLENLLEKHPIFTPFFDYSKNQLISTRGIWRLI